MLGVDSASSYPSADVTLSIAIAQLNPVVGDIAGNTALVRQARDEAAAGRADLLAFSELVLVGYPPEDLCREHRIGASGTRRSCRRAGRSPRVL